MYDTDYVNYENCRSRDCPLFCRSGPWSSDRTHLLNNIGVDFEDIIDSKLDSKRLEQSHCTKFQIGFIMSPQDTQIFEITEYLVTLHCDPIFRNLDLVDIFDMKLDEIKSNSKI